jgi:hypothetical protein
MSLLFAWKRRDADATENEFEALRIWLQDCPVMKVVCLPFDNPVRALRGLLGKRGIQETSYELKKAGHSVLENVLQDDDSIEFIDLSEINIRIHRCPVLFRLTLPRAKPWTALQARLEEVDFYPVEYRCSIQGRQCSDEMFYEGCEVWFHLSETQPEFTIHVRNCPMIKDCIVSSQTPWSGLQKIIAESGITDPYVCLINGLEFQNAFIFPDANIHFSFKLGSAHKRWCT